MADAPAAMTSSPLLHRIHATEELMISTGSSSVAVSDYAVLAPRSPRASSSPEVDFQEAILRANHKFVDRSVSIDLSQQNIISRVLREQEDEDEDEDEDDILAAQPTLPVSTSRSKPDNQQKPRHRSPIPTVRLRPTETGKEEDTHASHRSGTRKTADSLHSTGMNLERMKSPRRSRLASTAVDATEENLRTRRSHRLTRRSVKVQDDEHEDPDADSGMGDESRTARSTISRAHTRQHKRKPIEALPLSVMPPSTSEAPLQGTSAPLPPPYRSELRNSAYRTQWQSCIASSPPPVSPSSRRYNAEATPLQAFDWLQFIGDIIMWKHIPRSALLFGVGCFCIMSASLIQEMKYSVVSAIAYIALFYLAITFIKRTFMQGGTVINSAQYTYAVSEAEALRLLRLLLPPINLMLIKLGELFTGEPTVTLKVAFTLWLLAKAGSMMNLWTLARMAYFAIFTIPKFYSCYSEQMHIQAGSFSHRAWATWNACTHKKAVLFLTFVVLWNISSVSTRVCGAFIALVAVRAYQHVISREFGIGPNMLNRNIPSGSDSGAASVGFEMRRHEVQKRMQ